MTDASIMSKGKIQQAQAEYAKKGADSIEQDYRDLVRVIKDSHVNVAIPNNNYLHGLYLTDLMFQNSKKKIRILSGPGKDGWLDVLKDSLEQALRRTREAKDALLAIFLADEAPSAFIDLNNKYKDSVKYVLAKAQKPFPHFIVCDSRMVRAEDLHEELRADMDTTAVTAQVYLDNPTRAKVMEDYFDELWRYLEKDR